MHPIRVYSSPTWEKTPSEYKPGVTSLSIGMFGVVTTCSPPISASQRQFVASIETIVPVRILAAGVPRSVVGCWSWPARRAIAALLWALPRTSFGLTIRPPDPDPTGGLLTTDLR